MILGLVNAIFLASSFMIKSTYLLLYLSSISLKPWNFSGKGRNAFVKCVYSLTLIEHSPVFVINTVTLTPMISPISPFLTIS